MRKILLILGVLVFSALLFAHGSDKSFSNRKNIYNRRYTVKEYQENRFYNEKYKKYTRIRTKHSNKNQMLRIQISLNDFEIENFMIQGKVGWIKANRLNSQNYRPIKKLENNRLKNKKEMKKKFGYGFKEDKYTKDYGLHNSNMSDDKYEKYYMKRYINK